MIQRVLLGPGGKKFFLKNLKEDFHTQYGYIKAAELKKAKPGSTLTTNTGAKLHLIIPSFHDLYQKIGRGPQIIAPKDIGTIIAEAGIGRNTVVLDAGGGSGALCLFLA